MSNRTALKSSASPFAHLARTPKAEGGDDDTKKKDDAKKAKAEDVDEEDDGKDDETKKKDDAKKAKKAKAEDESGGEDKDVDAEDGDDDTKKDDAKKAKKAKKAEDESDDDMEDEEQDKDARAARARERSRIRAILVSEPGKANPVAAAHLATGTSMPRGQAIEMLAAMQAGMSPAPEPRRDNLRDRMAHVPNPSVGAEDQRPAPNLAAQIIAAGKKRRGEA